MRKILLSLSESGDQPENIDDEPSPDTICQRGRDAIRLIEDHRDLLLKYLVLRVEQNKGDSGRGGFSS